MKVLKFSDKGCAPCEVYAPIFDEWAKGVDIETECIVACDNPGEASKYRIMSVPATILIDDDGKVINMKVGIMKKEELDIFIINKKYNGLYKQKAHEKNGGAGS